MIPFHNRLGRVILCFLVTVTCGFVDDAASQEVTGRLEGEVLNAGGSPLAAARVVVSGPAMLGTRETVTGGDGRFRVPSLPAGRYSVTISGIGYRSVVFEDVEVPLGGTIVLGVIRLESQAVQLEPVVVQGVRSPIDPTTAAFGANLRSEEFEALPIDRDYESIVALLPQANLSYLGDGVNIGGATGMGNVFYIDGVNVTDPVLATGGTTLPYNFVREIQVKEGGYEAEFGKALGGIVNVVTHSGGDELRADAFAFVTNGALAADGRPGLVDLTLRDFATYDIGVSASGALVPGRLRFVAAYNPSFERRDLEVPGFGFHEDRLVSHRFAGKLTWQPRDETNLTLTAFGDPSRYHLVGLPGFGAQAPAGLLNPDPLLLSVRQGAVNVSLHGRTMLGSRAVIEGALARTDQTQEERGETERARTEPRFQDVTNTWSGGVAAQGTRDITRTSARFAATLFAGDHTVKAGLEYEENVLRGRTATNGPGIIQQLPDGSFVVNRIDSDIRVRNRVPTVYLQDGWRISRRVTVNAGVRWDGQFLIGVGDSVAQAFTDQFQPRLGFVVQPGELGSQKIFASYGRFYEQLPLFLSSLEHGGAEQCLSFYATDPRTTDPSEAMPGPCLSVGGVARSPKVDGLDGQHFDEFTLGYERTVGSSFVFTLRGVYRTLRAVVGVGITPTFETVAGNPGRGRLDFLPEPQRDYTALEVTAGTFGSGRLSGQVSYTLSRTYGNYPGLFASDVRATLPNWNAGMQLKQQGRNSTGLLPNDRPHVLKVVGSYRVTERFTAGTFFTWQSGTPLNEYGASTVDPFFPVLIRERGSVGRTPSIWDASLRLTYNLNRPPTLARGRIVLDLLHIGNPRTVVVTDQFRFLGRDMLGTHIVSNPNFGGALAHQPPMTLRLGVEMGLVR